MAETYDYNLLLCKIKEELPQNKTDGSAGYQTVVNEYDKSGNLVETKEQIEGDKNKEIEYTYDKQGNLVQVKSSLENEKAQYVQYVYDEQGNKVRRFTGMTGPLTVTVAAVENAKDDAGKDTFTYGGKTYAVLVTGKKKSDTIRETKYVYDTKNRLVSYTDPEGRTETYTYDCNSNLTKTVDKNGNTLKNTYDNQNRLTERTAKEKKTGKETVHTYRYNAYGDVAVQDDTQFVYGDVSGQVTKETTKLTKNKDVVKNYTYDSNGNKSTFSVKAGEDTKLSLSYEYDGSSRLISVKDSEGKQAVSYAYDTEGSLSERQAANGLKTTYGYDYQNRLTSMTNETGKGVVSKYSSTYLKNGQKAEEVSTVMDKNGKSTKKTAAYTYDMLGRITRETKTGREDISYTYDANNNRKQMTIGNKTTAYQYNKNDELLRTDTLHTDTEKNDVVIYKNDKNGNQLAAVNRSEIPTEAKDTSYIDVDVTLGDNQLNDNVVNHYNALNQLTETLTKNYKVSFTYDAEGLRTGKTVNGEKTIYVWDGEQVVMELSKGGAVQKRYIRGNDLVYADKGENTEKTYYVTDMHGNVVQLLDESGNVTKTYEYDSFGNEVKPEKKDENPYRYCGEYYDKETEEVYLRARYYEPGVGRFITRDTYTGESDEPLSLHLYTYCANDGVNYVDCDGNARSTPHPLPTPRSTIKPKSVPTPQPGPAPIPIKINYTSASIAQKIAQKYLLLTSWKSATSIECAFALANYINNKQRESEVLRKQYKQKFITNQSKLSVLKFGTSNMKNAGCELIAIYNAILLQNGGSCSLSDIIWKCELSGYTALTGQWGTNPYRIGDLLTMSKMRYSAIQNVKRLKMQKDKIYIISFWNRRSIFDGIHTIAVKVIKRNKIQCYNDIYSDKPTIVSGTFKKLLKGRPFIIGYKMKGRHK